MLKNIKDKIDIKNVAKTFLLAHVFAIITYVVVAVVYGVINGLSGAERVGQIPDIFSVVGIIAILAMMITVYKVVKRFFNKKSVNMANCMALEILVLIFGIVLYFTVNEFNIFSYYFAFLVPIIIAYYSSKRGGNPDIE